MDLIEDIIVGVIVTIIVGVGISYKVNKSKKNKGIIQKEGKNQVAIHRSKNTTVNIGGDSADKENRDSSR